MPNVFGILVQLVLNEKEDKDNNHEDKKKNDETVFFISSGTVPMVYRLYNQSSLIFACRSTELDYLKRFGVTLGNLFNTPRHLSAYRLYQRKDLPVESECDMGHPVEDGWLSALSGVGRLHTWNLDVRLPTGRLTIQRERWHPFMCIRPTETGKVRKATLLLFEGPQLIALESCDTEPHSRDEWRPPIAVWERDADVRACALDRDAQGVWVVVDHDHWFYKSIHVYYIYLEQKNGVLCFGNVVNMYEDVTAFSDVRFFLHNMAMVVTSAGCILMYPQEDDNLEAEAVKAPHVIFMPRP